MKIRNLAFLGAFLLGLPAVAPAQFIYITSNGAITIYGYTGTNESIAIPATIEGFPVTGISQFFSDTSYTNVTIPASVTNIATGAFAYQTGLLGIFADQENAYFCSSNGVLFDKDQDLLIQAPGGMAGRYVIPGSVASIGDSAFAGCIRLSGIAFPASVTNIGTQAFNGCASLTNVVIGPDILNIGNGAFADCASLAAITVDEHNSFYSSANGVLFDKPQWTLLQAPAAMAGSYEIPTGVTSIGTGAFADCFGLTEITVPDGVTNIASQAFYDCDGLTNLTLGANVMTIGDGALMDCSGLASLALPNGVTSIGNEAFEFCSGLTGILLGTNVASIGAQAFDSCSSLLDLLIPNSVTNIGSSALAYCGSLTNLTLGTQVASIGDGALEGCARLTAVAIPASVTSIGSGALGDCSNLAGIFVDPKNSLYSSVGGVLFDKTQTTLIQVPGGFAGSFDLPAGVTNVVDAAMAGCGRLTAITVDAQNAYFSATNGVLFDKLQTTLIQFPAGVGGSYTVGNGISRLGNTAFSGCANLASITIPPGVTNVGTSAFANCSHAGIFFEGNAPTIGTGGRLLPVQGAGIVIGSAFYNPNSEAVYYLPGTTGWSATFDGVAAYLWQPPYVCTPTSNSITINGFNGADTTLVIPDTIDGLPVTAIASGAFDNANGLGLTNVVLGTNVTTIGSYAFAACANLTSITIPASVASLGSQAFAFCDTLKSVYFQGNAPSANSSLFFQWSTFPIFGPVYQPPTPTTVYYLPGTTGWGATFGGQPAVLWNPQAQTEDGAFGPAANGFGFNITGASNLVVLVEAATHLSDSGWQPVQTVTLTGGSAYFSDPQWTNYPGRFYRFRSP